MTVSASASLTSPRCTRIVGLPGSGKTRELLARIAAAPVSRERLIIASPHMLAATRLGGTTLATYAFQILRDNAFESALMLDLERIDDAQAETHFEEAAASLFSLEWVEQAEPELGDVASLDYEIAGLRALQRFARAAYRLIRKLRAAGINPDRFLQTSLRKAADWYAKPPNLDYPELRIAAKRYGDSLNVDARELDRQRRREIDLAKILAQTYESYLSDTESRGCLTDVDAIAEATRVLSCVQSAAERARERYPLAFVDDAQDLTLGELTFLRGIYGKELSGVTFAGDPDQATRTFEGARPDQVFSCGEAVQLDLPPEPRATLVRAAREFLHDRRIQADARGRIELYRAPTREREATFVVEKIRELLGTGRELAQIAVLVRSLEYAHPYVEELLDADISVNLIGDHALFAERAVEDGLALLWSIEDPYRHDWLLRTLQTPTLRLSDASLVTLCGEPSNAQERLFSPAEVELEEDVPRVRTDRNREIRLGRNVVEGERDADLSDATRERLAHFREKRRYWRELFDDAPLEDAARVVFSEGGLFEREPGETPARHAHRSHLLEELLSRIAAFAQAERTRRMGDALHLFEELAASEWPQARLIAPDRPGVVVAQIDAIKGQSFQNVFIPNVRAGAFPPYWVPDAFVYTTGSGIIPKENVGEARASRTAKFTWYMHQGGRVLEHHAREARRLLYCAMTRATEHVWVSAWGQATRGTSAPELLAELNTALR